MKPATTEIARFLQAIGQESDEDNRATDAKRLYAAADIIDLQTRALLQCEWRDGYKYECGADCEVQPGNRHGEGCVLHAALTAVGLDTQEKRDAARGAHS